jgi:hypothetical protein
MKTVSRALLAALMVPVALSAQQGADTTKKDTAVKKDISLPPIAFSGTMYANYQYNGQHGASHSQNKFDLERVYLTFQSQLSDRTSIRVTTDVYQQTTTGSDAYYKGWTIRAKYAYLQYDYIKNSDITASLRGGLVHNEIIDFEEGFWPRWIAKTALDQNKFMPSADAGVVTVVGLPNKLGQFYGGVVNGAGYDNRETDRFKDYEARIALTPLMQQTTLPAFVRSLSIVPWYYKGEQASTITGEGEGLTKDRYGVFVGLKDPHAVLGFQYGQSKTDTDTGTIAARGIIGTTAHVMSAYTVLRPFQIMDPKAGLPIGLVFRYDQLKPNTSVTGTINTVIAGLTWDLSKRTAFSLDYQEATPQDGYAATPTKMYYLHWVANF